MKLNWSYSDQSQPRHRSCACRNGVQADVEPEGPNYLYYLPLYLLLSWVTVSLHFIARSEVLTAVKTSVLLFWVVTQCGLVRSGDGGGMFFRKEPKFYLFCVSVKLGFLS